jgi:hypothetical protein
MFDMINHGGCGSANAWFVVEVKCMFNLLVRGEEEAPVEVPHLIRICSIGGGRGRGKRGVVAEAGSVGEGSPAIVKDPSKEDHEDDNNDNNVFKDGDVAEFWMNGQHFDIHTMSVLFNLVEVAAAQVLLEGDVGELAKLT